MTNEQIFDQLVQEAADTLLSVPILNQLKDLKANSLHYLFSQLYYFVDVFPGLLGILLWKLPDIRNRFAIIDNLVDECGGLEKIWNNDPSFTHSGLLKYFTQSLTEDCQIAEKSSSTQKLLDNFSDFFINATPVEAMSAMAAMEVMSTQWFSLLYKQLLARDDLASKSLYFFEIHIHLDEEHGEILREVLMSLLHSIDSWVALKKGVMTPISIWTSFYTAVSQEMEDKFNGG